MIDSSALQRLRAIGLSPAMFQQLSSCAPQGAQPGLHRVIEVQREGLTLHDGQAERDARVLPALRQQLAEQSDALAAIGQAVRASVAAHQVADVPVGLFLSSGIDSALLTAIATAQGERPHTLTLAFAEYSGTPNDEAPLAEHLAAIEAYRDLATEALAG